MGLCTEFGPSIQHDCDQAMVAGHDSCSCPTCHVVCTGKFFGCAGVWARGPQPITLRSRGAAASSGSSRSSNGSDAAIAPAVNGMSDRRQQPQLGPANGSVSGIDPAVVHALLTEIRSLSRQLQHASSAQPNGVHDDRLQRSVDVLLGHLDRLPDRIADALGEALARQHRTIMTDVRASLADLAARLTPASEDNSR